MGRKRRLGGPTGVIAVDKRRGPTSREVVDEVVRRLGLGTAGHCGTLDPLASGLLVLVCGAATRVQDLLVAGEKRYEATARLGHRSATDDAEGPITAVEGAVIPDRAAVEAALASFRGEINQAPPAFSAVHVDGKRAWERARGGEEVEIPTRRVVIHELEVVSMDGSDVRIVMRCGPGTYVRSLVRDLGDALGCGAFVTELRRTGSGPLDVSDARAPDALDRDAIVPLEAALSDRPRLTVAEADLDDLLGGREVHGDTEEGAEPIVWCGERVVARGHVIEPGRFRMKRLIVDPRTT